MNKQDAGSGDDMALRVGRSSDSDLKVGVSGWFTITHTSAETGEETDFSGSNCLTRDGLAALSAGLNPGTTGVTTTTNAVAANALCGIWLSAATTTFAPGADQKVGTYATITVDASTNTGPWTDTVRGDGSTTDANVNMFFKATSTGDPGDGVPLDIFASASTNADPMVTSIATITVKHFHATPVTINSIFVADCDDGSGVTVKLLAGRVVSGSGTNVMTAVVMNQNDTLAIDYSISVDAT